MKNKSTKILALLLVCALLMGTGYAYWTDKLNITSTATTGDLDVTFVDFGYYAQYGDEQAGWSIIDGIVDGTENDGYVASSVFANKSGYNDPGNKTFYDNRKVGYSDVIFEASLVGATPIKVDLPDGSYEVSDTNGSDDIAITINNIYPGYAQAFRTDIMNNGNLAAKLTKISIDKKYKTNQAVENSIGIALLINGEFGLYDGYDGKVFKLASIFTDDNDIFTIGGVEFVRLSAFDDSSMFEQLEKILLCLPSSNRMDAYLGIAMDPNAENDTMNGEINFTIDFDWTQFNEGIGINAPANILKNQN